MSKKSAQYARYSPRYVASVAEPVAVVKSFQYDVSFVWTSFTSNVIRFDITNNSDKDLTVTRAYLEWVEAKWDGMFNLIIQGQVVWSGEDLDSPTDLTGGWTGEESRRLIPANSTRRFEWFTGTSGSNTTVYMLLGFEGTNFTVDATGSDL